MRLAADPKDAAVAARHPALADLHRTMFSATFNPAEAEKLFAGSGHTFAELLALADAQKPLPRFDSEEEPRGIGDHRKQQCGVAQYRGPARGLRCRAEEGIRAGLGASGPPGYERRQAVFAGAMDDASGVASVLEDRQELQPESRAAQALHALRDFHRRGKGTTRLALLRWTSDGAGNGHRRRSQHGHVHADLPAQETARAGTGGIDARGRSPRRRRRSTASRSRPIPSRIAIPSSAPISTASCRPAFRRWR